MAVGNQASISELRMPLLVGDREKKMGLHQGETDVEAYLGCSQQGCF